MVRHLESVRQMRRAPIAKSARPMQVLLRLLAERGDEEAFRTLYEAYAPRVKAYMMRLGADAALAEELAQETLLVVWRKAELYSEEKGSATTWIYTIARNLRIDRLRRELLVQELPSGLAEEPSEDPLPDEVVSGTERSKRVKAALAALPKEQYEVVVLAYIDGLSHSEIAGRLRLPPGTVKSRMRLAYHKVRDALEDLR